MHRAVVETHFRCNQACTFCHKRRSADDPADISPAAVRRKIERAVGEGAKVIVFSGGEPTMRGDLADLAAYATAAGASDVRVETNATLIDAAMAERFHAAGIRCAIVHLSAWGAPLDRLTRDPGGFDRALAGLRALVETPMRVEISVTVVRSTAAHLHRLPARLRETFGDRAPAVIVAAVPDSSPDPGELLEVRESVAAVIALEEEARRADMVVRLARGSAPPACVFPQPKRAEQRFALAPGGDARAGYTKLAACATCLVDDRCDGLSKAYLARFGVPAMTPIVHDRARRRLSILESVEEQIAREMVTQNYQQRDELHEDIVRVQFQCNQSCRFCFVSTHLPAPSEAQVFAAIEAAAARGARITLSGGEPTLSPKLAEYLAFARERTTHPIEVQTNAIRLADEHLCDELIEAGMARAFVSLHGTTAAISDAVTGAPGTFVRTLIGLDNLAVRPVDLVLNFVMCRTNVHDLTAWVRLAAERWAGATLTFSFVGPSTELVPRDRALIPSYQESLPEIARAVATANELGITLGGFESMCGLPLCLVPDSLAKMAELPVLPEGVDGGEFVRGEACDGCSLRDRCYGIRRGYAELYGTNELVRVEARGA